MKIRIYKDLGINLCLFALLYTLFIGFFTYNLGLPNSVLYLEDVILLLMIPVCFKRLSKGMAQKRLRVFNVCVLLWFFLGVISQVFYDIEIALLIWSVRNWGRGILYFLMCCSLLDKKIIDSILRFVLKLYHINVLVVAFQFFFLADQYTQDSLNGLLGRDTGGINITLTLVVLVVSLSLYFTKQIPLRKLIVYLVEVNVVTILSELKAVFLFEIVLVLFYAWVNARVSITQIIKYIGIALGILLVIQVGSDLLTKIYPEFKGFLTLDSLVQLAGGEYGYGNWGYIDRLNFISVVNERFFENKIGKVLFGIGLGSAEYSAYDVFCSDFYHQFGRSVQYLRFSTSSLYTETGIVGLTLFIMAFLSLFVNGWKQVRKALNNGEMEKRYYENIGVGAALVSVVYIFYNNLHRTDIAVILSFFCAIPIAMEYKGCYSNENHNLKLGE